MSQTQWTVTVALLLGILAICASTAHGEQAREDGPSMGTDQVTVQDSDSSLGDDADVLTSNSFYGGRGKLIQEERCGFSSRSAPYRKNPNKFLYSFKDKGTGCAWSAWSPRWKNPRPYPHAVERSGRIYINAFSNKYWHFPGWRVERVQPHPWNPKLLMRARRWLVNKAADPRYCKAPHKNRYYRNCHSNYYYSHGKWYFEKTYPHATNPTLRKVAGRWVPKPRTAAVRAYFYAPWVKKWYRNSHSNWVYKNGKFYYEKTFPHPTNPNLRRVAGRWIKKPLTSVSRHYFFAPWNKRWWRSRHSNEYYSAGRWVRANTLTHPTNPTIRMELGRWTAKSKDPEVRAMYKSPIGVWFRNKRSHEYYHDGKWGNFEVPRNHTTNPRFEWLAGQWQKRTEPAQHLWRKECGRWWRRPRGKTAGSFTWWKRVGNTAHWVTDREFELYVNYPFKRPGKCRKFYKVPVSQSKHFMVKGRAVFRHSPLPGGGYWFTSKYSLRYYKNLAWHTASTHLRDPRYYYDEKRKQWFKKTYLVDPDIKNYQQSGGIWYRDEDHLQYWFFGEWKKRKMTPFLQQRIRRISENREMQAKPNPFDMKKAVKQATDAEFAKFMRWFTSRLQKKETKATVIFDAKKWASTNPAAEDNPVDPEPGLGGKDAYDPESAEHQTFAEARRFAEKIPVRRDVEYPEPFDPRAGRPPAGSARPVADEFSDLKRVTTQKYNPTVKQTR
eukprot:TRINITY_DN11585_c0_g2_i1.p1 TRINITY_DN11585_c0_g2~~TRINITY_DN11585_c0_g2_i1.p1  ORF type:complete len:721 (-),score=157.25 TRINITY_DN11585_c0_g2_i1:193-2355(-)